MTKMTKEEFEAQADKLFKQIGEVVENAPAFMVAEISINLLEGCLLALPEDGQKMIAKGVMDMFRGIDEEMKRRKKLDS